MGFTVIHKGSTNGSQHAKYLDEVSWLLLRRGRSFDSVPRVRQNGVGDRWLYVWESKDEAAAVADALKKKTRDANWQVTTVTEEPSVGPLRPLDVELTSDGESWIFGLPPLSEMAVQLRFPGSCQRDAVIITYPVLDVPLPPEDELRDLLRQVLVILTGLKLEQLQVFGTFRLLQTVSRTELLAPAPFEVVNAGSGANGTNRRGTAGD